MKIFSADIAYFMGWIFVDYDLKTKKIKILDSGVCDLKKKKDHKDYWLHLESNKLMGKYKPNLVLYEEQFHNLMYRIEGAFASAIPPEIDIAKIFSKRARFLAFGDGGLSKEEAAQIIENTFPELKDKPDDIKDAMVLVMAWIKAFETGQPLKAPKKAKKKKKPKQ